METERTGGQDDSMPDKRREEIHDLPEYLSGFVLDHSRLDSAVLGSAQDVGLMERLRAVLFPGVKNWSKVRDNHVRDVMHVHTAVRYATTPFVTGEKHLCSRETARCRTSSGCASGAQRRQSSRPRIGTEGWGNSTSYRR